MNKESARQDADGPGSFQFNQPAHAVSMFKTNTIAPSPPTSISHPSTDTTSLSALDTSARLHSSVEAPDRSSPLSAGLRIHTDIIPGTNVKARKASNTSRASGEFSRPAPKSLGIERTPSIKNVFSSSLSSTNSAPGSVVSSPMLNAMADVTPLPSPLLSGDSPGPWHKLVSGPPSRDLSVPMTAADSVLVTANGESISSAIANQTKRRAYHGLSNESGVSVTFINKEKNAEGHTRNRSISDYIPDAIQIPKIRNITVSGSHTPITDTAPDSATSTDSCMRREPHLAVQRGLAPIPRPPTPPSSRTGAESSDSDSSLTAASVLKSSTNIPYEYFEARTRGDSKKRRWRALKVLGEGTFSKVMLATSQASEVDQINEDDGFGSQMDGILTPTPYGKIDRKKLVAVKICEHGPKGGASEERVEMSLKRELDIMKSIHHPSLVHLKAWNVEETRAILVLSYCAGGDLFEVASQHRDLLVPALLRRMFSELVGAVKYLHSAHIVHRDIKLENVLVNLPQHELARTLDWTTYPYSIITLTDLGLSRRVTEEEKLTTRCGSDDYAAPEVILGQPYDGRATDAWSLGVLLYALLESRLPFDPHPGMTAAQQLRSRTSHRIARVEWVWVEYAGDEGDHEGDPQKFRERGLEGAMVVTEGLLRRTRNRWSMDQVGDYEWVKGAIPEGGLKFREEDNPAEVLDIDSSPL